MLSRVTVGIHIYSGIENCTSMLIAQASKWRFLWCPIFVKTVLWIQIPIILPKADPTSIKVLTFGLQIFSGLSDIIDVAPKNVRYFETCKKNWIRIFKTAKLVVVVNEINLARSLRLRHYITNMIFLNLHFVFCGFDFGNN